MLLRLLMLYRKCFWSNERYARFLGVKIGNYCEIQKVSFGSEPYLVTVGDNVQITYGTRIFTHGGAHVLRKKSLDFDFFGKVIIKNNVYIGNNCLIMPGVTIGENVIVAAGAVVTKSIPDNVVVGGNPARILTKLDEFERKMEFFNLRSKGMNSIDKRNFLMSLPEEKFIKK